MQQSFTKKFMESNSGCYNKEQLYKCSFMQTENEVQLSNIIKSEISLKDKYWFVCKKLLPKQENQQVAIKVAEIVLPIFEAKYPNDLRPREAIEAAKLYITGHISLEQLKQKRSAAYDAAAAYATYNTAADAAAADAAAADVRRSTKEYQDLLFQYLVNLTSKNE